MANTNLTKAKREKNDEFYTLLKDIENELQHYTEHFKDKVVYCNCDSPDSNFVKYFNENKERLGIKEFYHTWYNKETGEGSFDSPESIELLEKADIVVTNPPFSLFRKFIALMELHKKKYLVIGNMNAVCCRDIFPLIKNNKLWLGVSPRSMDFLLPSGQMSTVNACWFTNLNHSKRNEKLILTKEYNPVDYPKYDNYDAINVDRTKDIPKDYYKVVGVPITFLDKYNPEQFEIVGVTDRQNTSGMRTKKYTENDNAKYNDFNRSAILLSEDIYRELYTRILIKRK